MDIDQKQEEIKNNIYEYLKQGMYKKDAAKMAGIDESTLYRWIDSDASFASRVEVSILEYKHSLLKIINSCAEKDGRLALEVLRRRFPDTEIVEREENEMNGQRIADLLLKMNASIYERDTTKVLLEDNSEVISPEQFS